MPLFTALPGERRRLSTPIAIQLVDIYTQGPTLGSTRLILEAEVEPGKWQASAVEAFKGAQGIFAYPSLGRSANVDRPPVKHRVVVESQFYERYVPKETDEFQVWYYNDSRPLAPGQYARAIRKVFLQPNASYPYESHIPVLRGRISKTESPEELVEGAVVEYQWVRAISNKSGEYALPVRFPPRDTETVTPTLFNEIHVRNARGYYKAKISIEGMPSVYRVDEIIWHSATTDEARLSLQPEPGDDLPAGLRANLKVTVRTMALHIDLPDGPVSLRDIDPRTFLPSSSR